MLLKNFSNSSQIAWFSKQAVFYKCDYILVIFQNRMSYIPFGEVVGL